MGLRLGGINKQHRNKEVSIEGGSRARPVSRISSGLHALSYLCRRACTNTGCSPCSSTRCCCWWASMTEAKNKKRGVESLLVVVVEVVVVAWSRCCRWWWPSS